VRWVKRAFGQAGFIRHQLIRRILKNKTLF
jgi:hypothetical protein